MTNDNHPPEFIGPDHQLAGPAPPARAGRKRWVILACVLLGAGGFAWWLIVHHRNAAAAAALDMKKPAGVAISTVRAQAGSIGVYLDSIGTVTPVHTVSITSQVAGLIIAVHYREGDSVARGAPLIDIDPRPYEAMLLQAQGTLARDEGLLAQAQMDYTRYRSAFARHAIAQQIVEDQEKLVLQDQGTVMNDQGLVRYDRLQVAFCHITAPLAGRVGLRLVDPGNVVQSSGAVTLAVITQMQPITIIFTITADDLGAVLARLGTGAKLRVDAEDKAGHRTLASGELLTIGNQIDTTTGTVKGRAVFDNRNGAFFPNQFVNTRLLVNTLDGVILAPSSAIQLNGHAAFVYVIQGGVAHLRAVKTGVTDGGTTQVVGLAAGDVLANSGFDLLQDNAAVVIADEPAAAAAKAPAASPQAAAASADN